MTYKEAVEKIDSLLVFGSKPGLERVGELIKRIGSPDKKLKFVHTAGTNGKGSTCVLVANTLKCAGYKTGLFISPYVLEFRERFQINGEMIPEEKLCEIVEKLFPVVEEMKAEDKIITEFEFVFAIAMYWYAEEKCDVVVLETGLGGRFDATNIIDTPLVSVITSISLDHTAILGDTYEKIAFEKCGIIKPNGITVAYGEQKGGVIDVIKNTACERKNKLYIADKIADVKQSDLNGSEFSVDGVDLKIRFIGKHQIKNALTAYCAVKALRERGLNISESAVKEGFASAFFPARLEILKKEPIVMLDGSHNPDGVKALANALKENMNGIKKIGIVGMLADKDVKTALGEIVSLFDEVITVSPNNPRKMSAEELAEIIRGYGVQATPESDYEKAYQEALLKAGNDKAVIVFGSLYLSGDMRKIIKNL